MPIQSTRKGVSSDVKLMLILVGGSAEVVLEANRKQRRQNVEFVTRIQLIKLWGSVKDALLSSALTPRGRR